MVGKEVMPRKTLDQQALERMEAAIETVVDADDSPHLAAVR